MKNYDKVPKHSPLLKEMPPHSTIFKLFFQNDKKKKKKSDLAGENSTLLQSCCFK